LNSNSEPCHRAASARLLAASGLQATAGLRTKVCVF
jgi:hypothetical protein